MMIKKITSLLLVSMLLLTFAPKSYAFGEPVFDETSYMEALATKLHIIEMYKMQVQKIQEAIDSVKNGSAFYDIFSSKSHGLGQEIPTSGSEKIGQYK